MIEVPRVKVVSYAYFRSPTSIYEKIKGDAAIQFEQFLALLIRAHHCVWRGWEMRIHHDDHVTTLPYWKSIERMAAKGLVGPVKMGPTEPLCKSMLWRLTPALQGQDKIVLCRDVDSVPMPRERWAVSEWLDSGKAVHVIHDAAPHSGVMGGTLGVRSHRFQELLGVHSMEEFLALGHDFQWEQQGADQHLLNRLLPKYATETFVHELHHRVNDMGPVYVQDYVASVALSDALDMCRYMNFNQIVKANTLCSIIGGCTEPVPALQFYDSIDFPERDDIRACER